MNKHYPIFAITLLLCSLLFLPEGLQAQDRLRIGVTLHPYYSFAANIVGDRADVVPLIGADYNPHNYNPQPQDLQRAQSLDVLIVNGIGHDQWAFEIMEAATGGNTPYIYANNAVSLIPVAGSRDQAVNAHTFISTTTAIQQVYEIARELGRLDPDNASEYTRNARAYATRLRALKAEYSARFAEFDTASFRPATMHGAYGYLMQEFGLQIAAVIEPRHGVEPTARQLAQTIDEIRAAGVNVLFAERYFAGQLAETIENATDVQVFTFSHISDGPYRADFFEEEMRYNLESLHAALLSTAAQ